MNPFLFLFVLLYVTPAVFSSPIPTSGNEPGASPLIALAIAIPLVFLGTAKLVYLRYRRAQSIHSYDSGPIEIKPESASQQWIGLGIEHHPAKRDRFNLFKVFTLSKSTESESAPSSTAVTGYLVGCFGSPQWETRLKAQADRAARKATPSNSSSFNKDHFSPSEIRSAIAVGSIRSTIFSQSVYTKSGYNSNSLGTNSLRTGTNSRRHTQTSSSSRVPSVSFLEMSTPNLNMNMDITNCGSVHPGSPACNEQIFGSRIVKYQTPQNSRRSSRNSKASRPNSRGSITPRPSPAPIQGGSSRANSSTEESSRSDSDNSRSFSRTPSFQHGSTEEESSATMSSMSSEQFMAGLIFPDTSLVLPHDIGYTPTMAVASPDNKRSPKVTIQSVSSIQSTLSTGNSVRSPRIRVTPPKEDSDPTTPVPGRKPSGHRSSAHKGSKSGRKKSKPRSPRETREIKPEPKPNPIEVRPLPLEDCVSESRSISTDWLLEDLIRDGMLDVDAVHSALGLGLPSPPIESSPRYPTTRSPDPGMNMKDSHNPHTQAIGTSDVDMHIRKPGGLLFSIPEETEDISDAGHSSSDADDPAQLVGLWEAACRVDFAAEDTSSAESSTLPTPVVAGHKSQWYF